MFLSEHLNDLRGCDQPLRANSSKNWVLSVLRIHGDNTSGCGAPNGITIMHIYRWITLVDQADFEKKKVNFGNLIKIVNYAKKKKSHELWGTLQGWLSAS